MSLIKVSIKDTFNIILELDPSEPIDMRKNLTSWFSQFAPGYQFDWKFKNRKWDGKIKFYNSKDRTLPIGLLSELKKFAKVFDYKLELSPSLDTDNFKNFSNENVKDFIYSFVKGLNLTKEPYSYQYKYFARFLQKNIELIISPTSSGKSLIIYMCMRYALSMLDTDKKALIIVPTVQLVDQMYSDFIDYGFDSDTHCAKIYSGSTDQKIKLKTNKKIIISTWQSLYKLSKEEFDKIGFIAADEIHRFGAVKAKSVIINCENAIYRLGTTGTLQKDDICSAWTIQGMFDEPTKYVSTKKLIESGKISNIEINVLNLIYQDDISRIVSKFTYNEEIDFICIQEKRIDFIISLCKKLVERNENSLLLFSKIEYGKRIKDAIVSKIYNTDFDVPYVDGSIDMKYREEIRKRMENESGIIAVCSFGTFSTGINIKNLHNIIFLNPIKSEITVLQSLGRSLRLHESKDKARVWDIVDNMKCKKKNNKYRKDNNFALDHFEARKKIYDEEGFKLVYHNFNI